jgi:hypothetical protein
VVVYAEKANTTHLAVKAKIKLLVTRFLPPWRCLLTPVGRGARYAKT